MPSCPGCGAENTEDKKFCTSCGAPLAPSADEPAPPETPARMDPETLPPLLRPKSLQRDTPPSETAPPDFDIKATPHTAAAPPPPRRDIEADDEEFEPHAPGLLERKPWLLHVTCLGTVGFIIFAFASVLVVRIPQKLKERRALMGSRELIPDRADAAGDTCFIKAVQTVGDVLVQIREGRNLDPLKPGGCLPAGGGVYTRDDARAHLRFEKIGADVNLNANTSAEFTLMGRKLIVTLNRGEIWLQSKQDMAAQFVLPMSMTEALGPGKFHIITRDQQTYFTCSAGKMKVGLPGKSFSIESGQQVSFVTGKKPLVQDIDLDAFHNWVNAWKSDWTEPQKPSTEKSADGKKDIAPPSQPPPASTPDEKPVDHKRLIIQAARSAPEFAKLPKYVAIEVDRFTDKWAIAVLRDTRTDADLKDDYQPTTPLLLSNKDGHWTFLEEFEDYNVELYNRWARLYGFTKKDATALKLQY